MGKISISFQVKTIWEEAQMRMEVIQYGKVNKHSWSLQMLKIQVTAQKFVSHHKCRENVEDYKC